VDRKRARKDVLPLELANTPRTDDDHCWLHKVDDVKQHVSCILGVPALARESHVELGPLEKTDRLPNEDVSQALALHRV